MDTRFTASDRAVQAALAASKEASDKAERAANERFKATNEFRGQLTDQAATFVGRPEYFASHSALTEKLDVMTERVNALELRLTSRLDQGSGRQEGTQATYAFMISVASVLIALGTVLAVVFH